MTREAIVDVERYERCPDIVLAVWFTSRRATIENILVRDTGAGGGQPCSREQVTASRAKRVAVDRSEDHRHL